MFLDFWILEFEHSSNVYRLYNLEYDYKVKNDRITTKNSKNQIVNDFFLGFFLRI